MISGSRCLFASLVVLGGIAAASAADDDISRALEILASVSREGKGNDAAGAAWKLLVARGTSSLLPSLAAIDDAKPLAANWLRTAVETIAETETKAGRKLPIEELEGFLKDRGKAPSARRLAYELLLKQDPAAKDRLLPGFLDDPSLELRRDAIAAELGKARSKAELERLFGFTRDKDQAEGIAKKLETEHKTKVSVTEHFAFITHWHLVGPFFSEKGKALTLVYPPEMNPDLEASFPGKNDRKLTWSLQATADRYGMMDLNKVLGKNMNAAAYASAIVRVEKETPCEIRAATPNAIQIFLNGKKLFEREEYHHGARMDYHAGTGTLRPGDNRILIKICQNNQKDSWAQDWKFQARVCDSTGGAIPGLRQIVPLDGKPASIKLGFTTELEGKK